MENPQIKVIGFGNPLRGDEGIGPRLIEELKNTWAGRGVQWNCRFLDLGTAGMRLISELNELQALYVVDCAFMELEPGAIRRFVLKDVQTMKLTSQYSFHDMDLVKILTLAETLGICPPEVVLFGIQPASIDFRMELSPDLERRVPEYLNLISDEIKKNRPPE